jgi:hypothetical protein
MIKLLSLLARIAIAGALSAAAARGQAPVPSQPAKVNPLTGALLEPLESAFKSANHLAIGTDIQAHSSSLDTLANNLSSGSANFSNVTAGFNGLDVQFVLASSFQINGGLEVINSSGDISLFDFLIDGNGSTGTTGQVFQVDASGFPAWADPLAPHTATAIAVQTVTTTNGTWTDITGLSVTYTPTSSSNHVLVTATIQNCTSGAVGAAFRVVRNGSMIVAPTAPTSGFSAHAGGFSTNSDTLGTSVITLDDAPASTSSCTWKVQACVVTGSTGTVYLQQTPDTGSAYNFSAASTLVIQEHR